MLKVALYLVYIYFRKFYTKGDLLTFCTIFGIISVSLIAIYQNYYDYYYLLFLFAFGTLFHHFERKDLNFLKNNKYYKKIIFLEYLIINIPFISLFLIKKDFLFALIYLIFIGICVFIPQNTIKIKYPFDVTDPFWHISFRKYKLIGVLPIVFVLIFIGKIYNNINLGIFGLFLVAFLSVFPYFERESIFYIHFSHFSAEKYIRKQIITGGINFLCVFTPFCLTFWLLFAFEQWWIVFVFFIFPLLNLLMKYTFFENILFHNIIFVVVLSLFQLGVPLLVLPFFYYKSIAKIKKIQYVTN